MEEKELVNEQPRTSTRSSMSARQTQDTDKAISKEDSEVLKEIAINSVDLNIATCSSGVPGLMSARMSISSRPVSAKMSFANKEKKNIGVPSSQMPLIMINSPTGSRHGVSTQPRSFSFIQSPISAMSLIMQSQNQPATLFKQALAKLNENKLSVSMMNDLMKIVERVTGQSETKPSPTPKSPEISPPDSLTSAPPSYSFVLRQSARRRPRLMGTFIPSPSFVQHTPPPNYATAFDIYVDNPAPQQEPTRIYSFGFTSMPIICPECGYAGLTAVTTKVNLCTHFCALVLCLFCCWFCAPLPYLMRSCKDVYHHCRNCRALLGMYSPTSPDTTYPQVM